MSEQRWKVATAAGLGVIAALLLHGWGAGSDRRSAELQSGAVATAGKERVGEETKASRGEVAALRAELGALRDQLSARPSGREAHDGREHVEPGGPPAPSAAAPHAESEFGSGGVSDDPGPDLAGYMAAAEEREQRHFDQLDARLNDEPLDASWSATATDRISSALAFRQDLGLQVDQIDCRSSLCRVAIRLDPAMDVEELLLAIPPETRGAFPRLAVRSSSSVPGSHVLFLSTDRGSSHPG